MSRRRRWWPTDPASDTDGRQGSVRVDQRPPDPELTTLLLTAISRASLGRRAPHRIEKSSPGRMAGIGFDREHEAGPAAGTSARLLCRRSSTKERTKRMIGLEDHRSGSSCRPWCRLRKALTASDRGGYDDHQGRRRLRINMSARPVRSESCSPYPKGKPHQR
jgi:hypothetical protein